LKFEIQQAVADVGNMMICGHIPQGGDGDFFTGHNSRLRPGYFRREPEVR